MNPLRASIIIVSYNSSAYLPACLDSILQQQTAADEVIVVDNGSSDGSADLVCRYYPAVKLIRAANSGYAGGNNLGAAAARGRYLVFLNPDTQLEAGALAALLAPLVNNHAIALSTACLVLMDAPERINTCGNIVHYTGLAYCRGLGQLRSAQQHSCFVNSVSGAAFAIRRSVFEQLGGFDSRFFMYVEDTDLSLRARLAGYRIWYAADAIIRHDYRPGYSPSKAYYLDRNRHLMLLKNYSRASYRQLLPGMLLAELLTWGFLLIKGPRYWLVKPRVYWAIWQERRALRQARAAYATPLEHKLLQELSFQLAIGQFAHAVLAALAGAMLHPLFRILHPYNDAEAQPIPDSIRI
jgi:GT2 family glycosyltransferase